MKLFRSRLTAIFFALVAQSASAMQADDTTITIAGHVPGVTPFISQLHLTASDTTTLRSIQLRPRRVQ